jgi:DNA (cytosine-5)-methyltransferase 1
VVPVQNTYIMRTIPALDDQPYTETERAGILDRVDEILELTHRSAGLGDYDDPLEEAAYVLLSRQAREAEYHKARLGLRARWRDWAGLQLAPVNEVAGVIEQAGFRPTQAAQLQSLLRAVADACHERGIRNRITLDWLRDLPEADVEKLLLGLPGVGLKSAPSITRYALGRSTLAGDDHVRRILDRLGAIPDPGEEDAGHGMYEAAVPAKVRQRLHGNLVHHGRAYCRPDAPRCESCPLISFCPTGRARQDRDTDEPVAVELFAGGGGMGEGFARAGFRIALAVELDRAAAQTYRVNHPGTVVLEADAMAVTAGQLEKLAPLTATATAIIAGPPCQGYSVAGKRKADDKKNELYTAVINLAREIQPRFVIIENVPGMRKVEGKSFVDSVLDSLDDAGYAASEHLLRACDYGVPQLRRRLLFLAQHRDYGGSPPPPSPTHCAGDHCENRCGKSRGSRCGRKPTPTVLEALASLPRLGPGRLAEYVELRDGTTLLNGSTMDHSQAVIEKIRTLAPGTGPISYRRLHRDIARTIVAGHRALPVHPVLDRTISVREAAKIQGFGDSHVFAGSRSQQPLQVANAVPPLLAQAVAEVLMNLYKSHA